VERVSDKDLNIIAKQLDRNVENVLSVERYCSFGFPVVILSYPVRNGKPFPTIHYLTCPHLVKEVSKLEEQGYVKKYERLIEDNIRFFSRLEQAHKDVIKKRMSLLKPEDSEWDAVLASSGTGGIRNWKTLKCLHLHLADYLAGIDNPIGELVYNQIEKKECGECYCCKL